LTDEPAAPQPEKRVSPLTWWLIGGGVLALVGIISRRRVTGEQAEVVELVGLYWHFVDIVWIVIFTLVYLIPA